MGLLGHGKQQWLVQATLRQFCFIIIILIIHVLEDLLPRLCSEIVHC